MDCEPDTSEDERRRYLRWKTPPFEIGFNANPFHYMIRSSGYGELYDEIPWKLMFGAAVEKDRGTEKDPLVCRYRNGVRIHNWLENEEDREFLKFSRTAPISQYAHIYKTTYGSSIGKKWVCDLRSSMLRKMPVFPKNVFPGHQPELDVDRLRCCVEKPTTCDDRQDREACFRRIAQEKRLARDSPPPKQAKTATCVA